MQVIIQLENVKIEAQTQRIENRKKKEKKERKYLIKLLSL